ncbi:MAG: SDR family oxidoreductase [Proteobacteria bacterium]|nr:SDR family oxidoreductase [Pseudomonadota bacterium]
MTRILVAGATGYLGGFVVKEFKARGHFVRALARSPEKLAHLAGSLDEIVQGEVTRPETLEKVCDGMDIVFSSVGITKQKDGLTFRDVDYQGNVNLINAAQRAGVKKFIYVSVINGPDLPHLDIVKAHEDFVHILKASGINYAILRPTGYFSDMGEFFEMAKKGRVYVIGQGNNRTNPIHGADLATRCVNAVEGRRQEIDVGGPEILTYRQIAEMACVIQNKPIKITSVPIWFFSLIIALTRLFSHHTAELLAFFTTMVTTDVVGPVSGTHTLGAYYQELGAMK